MTRKERIGSIIVVAATLLGHASCGPLEGEALRPGKARALGNDGGAREGLEVETDDTPDSVGHIRNHPVSLGKVDVRGAQGIHEDAPGSLEASQDRNQPGGAGVGDVQTQERIPGYGKTGILVLSSPSTKFIQSAVSVGAPALSGQTLKG